MLLTPMGPRPARPCWRSGSPATRTPWAASTPTSSPATSA